MVAPLGHSERGKRLAGNSNVELKGFVLLDRFNTLVLNKVNDPVSSSVEELNVVDLPEGVVEKLGYAVLIHLERAERLNNKLISL
mgnify:CR=1 FL=1